MIQVAVALGIADSLHDGPKPATKLVTDSGADANMVLRLCRALSAFGIFEVDSEDMVSQSARSAWLRKDARPTLLAHLIAVVCRASLINVRSAEH